jgi:hypothetical protein
MTFAEGKRVGRVERKRYPIIFWTAARGPAKLSTLPSTYRLTVSLVCPTGSSLDRSACSMPRGADLWAPANFRFSEFFLTPPPNQHYSDLVPLLRGALRNVTDAGSGMRWTRAARLTGEPDADGKIVWSWRPDAGVKFLGSKLLRDDGGKKARSPGRARYKP